MAAWLDPLTRRWWRTVGRPVDPAAEQTWLDAPMSDAAPVRDGWMAAYAARVGGSVRADVPDAGLLADLSALDGPGFAAASLHPAVRDFYEHTAAWRMEVWTGWTPAFRPFGELVSRLFGRRVEQLALPTRPLDVARGMDSRVSVIADGTGTQVAAGWLRTLRATGETVYSGSYTSRLLPGADRPSVHVTFPLEAGNVQVFLRPVADPDGSLWLHSPGEPFGGDGAYVVVRDGASTHAARAPTGRPSTCSSTTRACCAPTTCCGSGRPPRCACTTGWTDPAGPCRCRRARRSRTARRGRARRW